MGDTEEGDRGLPTFELTHEEIALAVLSDRVSVTRALRKMKEAGMIELGYKTIKLHRQRLVAPTQ
jgi:CRP-like cAMP-binding protein